MKKLDEVSLPINRKIKKKDIVDDVIANKLKQINLILPRWNVVRKESQETIVSIENHLKYSSYRRKRKEEEETILGNIFSKKWRFPLSRF